jgi:hypothetical protein
MNTTNNNTSFLKFSREVPDPTLPAIFEVRGHSWVNYGIDNLYVQNIVTPIYNGSSMVRTCVNSKQTYTVGEGLRTKNPDLEYVLKRANGDLESWTDIFSRSALDYIIYGGFALQIIWDETGTTITDIYNMDFGDIRSGHYDKETDRVEWYYYSADWSKYKKDIYKPKAIKAFDPNTAHLYPRQLLYARNYQPGNKYYPLPSYAGALTAANVDVMIDSFHWFNLQNGLAPSLFISMNNGIPDPETRQDIYDELASSFSGVEGAGKFFLSFANDKEHGTEVTPIDAANSDYYVTLSQRISQQILTGMMITSPLLLGIKDIGGAGLSNNKDEILVASQHFNSTVIVPIQKYMLKIFDKLMHYYGYPNNELYIEPLRLFNEDGLQVGEASVDANI